MKKLKDVKKEMYEHMKDRCNDFLSEEERYIVEHLVSFVNVATWSPTKYTEDEACDIACQWLDWICSMTDVENTCWEAWYIRWYEVALRELLLKLNTPRHLEVQRLLNKLLTN